jgi:curved DNA-binding protein CbpA
MTDPHTVFGVAPEADDATIRRRYLELVRQFTPERHPKQFAAICAAYEQLKDLDSRVRYRLFEQGRHESIDALIEEIGCQKPRPRLRLTDLLAAQGLGKR